MASFGIKLPFGWNLVRDKDFRRLQWDLREAEFRAGVRMSLIKQHERERLLGNGIFDLPISLEVVGGDFEIPKEGSL